MSEYNYHYYPTHPPNENNISTTFYENTSLQSFPLLVTLDRRPQTDEMEIMMNAILEEDSLDKTKMSLIKSDFTIERLTL